MRHAEQRTGAGELTHSASAGHAKSRPLFLLVLAALALLASSCATAERGSTDAPKAGEGQVAEQVAPTNAPTSNANVSANMNGTLSSPTERPPYAPQEQEDARGESYAKIDENPFLEAARAPLSTFSIDVDTAT